MSFSDTFAVLRQSPWFMGLAVGGGIGALSLVTHEGPLPVKLGGAVMAASFAALRSARRRGRRKLRQQPLRAVRGEFLTPHGPDAPSGRSVEMPAGDDFRAHLARRSARVARPLPQPPAPPGGVAAVPSPLSDIDRRCAALERDVGSSSRMF